MRAGIGEIKINFSANEIVHDHMLTRRTEPERALVLENMSRVLQFLQIVLVNFSALTLKIGPEIPADMRTFVPVNSQPLESLVNRSRGFLGIALGVGVFDAQHQFATVMMHKEPVEERSARATDVQITGRRRRETNADFGTHGQDCSRGGASVALFLRRNRIKPKRAALPPVLRSLHR